MAAPIGHLYLALKLLAGPLSGIDEEAFIIGTSFPDIRTVAKIPRESTHVKNVPLEKILHEPNSFKQGMLFHAYVDEEYEKFMREQHIGSLLPNIPYAHNLLKGLADRILFEELKNRSFIHYFDKILKEELAIVPNISIVRAWHTYLQNYFFYGPTPQTLRPFVKNKLPDFGLLQPLAEQSAAYGFTIGTEIIKFNYEIVQKIKAFYHNFRLKLISH